MGYRKEEIASSPIHPHPSILSTTKAKSPTPPPKKKRKILEAHRTPSSVLIFVGSKTAAYGEPERGLSKGALIAIIFVVLILAVVVIGVIIYRCRQISYYRGQTLMARSVNRFSDLKSRLVKTSEIPYQEEVD